MVNVKLSGFDELGKRLEDAPGKIVREVDAELELAAEDIRTRAAQDAPGDVGTLRTEIQTTKQGDLSYGIFSNALYSGYVEFGTKTKVSIPPGLEEIASEILGGSVTSSLTAKEAIYAWVKRKGIDPELSWPIFISIMTKGINPHPFFFKQLDIVQPDLLKRIENILNSI